MKKIGLICLVLVLALGSIGVGFAMWSETLTIDATVNTDEVDWEFVDNSFDSKDKGNDWTGDLQVSAVLTALDKDVGSTTGYFTDEDGDGDLDTLWVTIHNAYPSYANDIAFWLHCNGTMPMYFEKVIINPGGIELTTAFPPVAKVDLTGEGDNDIEILWGDHIGTQWHFSNEAEISFLVHVLQDAPEGQSLSFSMSLVAVQWNESIHNP